MRATARSEASGANCDPDKNNETGIFFFQATVCMAIVCSLSGISMMASLFINSALSFAGSPSTIEYYVGEIFLYPRIQIRSAGQRQMYPVLCRLKKGKRDLTGRWRPGQHIKYDRKGYLYKRRGQYDNLARQHQIRGPSVSGQDQQLY